MLYERCQHITLKLILFSTGALGNSNLLDCISGPSLKTLIVYLVNSQLYTKFNVHIYSAWSTEERVRVRSGRAGENTEQL